MTFVLSDMMDFQKEKTQSVMTERTTSHEFLRSVHGHVYKLFQSTSVFQDFATAFLKIFDPLITLITFI